MSKSIFKTRTENLAKTARNLAAQITTTRKAYFGTDGITFDAKGNPRDIVGALIVGAGCPVTTGREISDPKEAIAQTLLVKVDELSPELQGAINNLAVCSDDVKRASARRIPRLCKLLEVFAVAVTAPNSYTYNGPQAYPAVKLPGQLTKQPQAGFQVPGKSL